MRAKQMSFSGTEFKKYHAFGGTLLRDKRNRVARPVSTRHPIHLILKSSQARGAWSFLQPRNRKILDRTLAQMSERYGVRVLKTGNAGNHIHLLLKFSSRTSYLIFIRVLTGTMVRRICGIRALDRKFFDFRPFTRIVEGGLRGFRIAWAYIHLNELEGRGQSYSKNRTRGSWRRERPALRHPS